MGDLANMTDCDGRVNGPRLLRWLRSRAETYRLKEKDAEVKGYVSSRYAYHGRAVVLEEMALDLERELTPPDYPGDDGLEPERLCPNCRGTGVVRIVREGSGPDTIGCQACHGTGEDCTVDDDTVDLDDPALAGGPEAEEPELPGTIMYRRHGVLYSIVPWPESIANPHGHTVAVIRGGEVVGGAADGAAVVYGMRDGLWDEKKEV